MGYFEKRCSPCKEFYHEKIRYHADFRQIIRKLFGNIRGIFLKKRVKKRGYKELLKR